MRELTDSEVIEVYSSSGTWRSSAPIDQGLSTMHVVFVLPRFLPHRGGYENSVFALSKHLVTRGHRVTVFTTIADDLEAFWLPGFKTFPEGEYSLDGVTVRRFPICYDKTLRRLSRLLGLIPYWRWEAQFWRPSFRIPGLHQALRSVDADLVHIGPLPYTNLMYAGLRAAENRRVPIVATPCVHLGEEDNDEVSRHYLQRSQLKILQRCATVFCMTGIELRRLAQLGVTSRKLVVRFGIDLGLAMGGNSEYLRMRYNVDGPVILHLGTKAFDKGSVTLVEAMKLLWQRGSNAWLVMAGSALSDFERYIAANRPASPRFLNLPPFADQEKRELLASATVVAQPSRVESLGLVMLEAWANAKPVVAANIAVSRALVTNSGGGVVVPFGNANALAAEIEKLLANPELCRTMGWCGQEKALGDEDTRGRRICEEFEHLVGAVGAKGRRQHSVPPAMIPDSIGRNDRPDQAKPGKYKSRPWVREL